MGGKLLDIGSDFSDGRTYEIRFEAVPKISISRWFRVKKKGPERKPAFNLNSIAQALEYSSRLNDERERSH